MFAAFIGGINVVPAEVRAAEAGHLRVPVDGLGEVLVPAAAGAAVGTPGVFAIRLWQLQVAAPDATVPEPNRLAGQVRSFCVDEVTTYRV